MDRDKMSDPPTYDQHLLDRLNALKKSNVQLDATAKQTLLEAGTNETPESDLSSRLRSLRSGSLSPSPAPKSSTLTSAKPSQASADLSPLQDSAALDDRTLEELLEELGSEDQWTLDPDDPKDIQKLLNEAKAALPSDDATTSAKHLASQDNSTRDPQHGKTYLTKDLDMSAFALDDGESTGGTAKSSNLEYESRETQDIVAKLLDEVSVERQNEPQAQKEDSKEDSDTEFSLPAVPSKLPEPLAATEPESSKKSLDFESDIVARMAALKGIGTTDSLGLPSAPTFKPLDKPVKGIEKKYTDEEVDSWCLICQDDATVECLGCDGDLYCAMCWKEGHMGPDVGWEEKKHKWTKYRKPK